MNGRINSKPASGCELEKGTVSESKASEGGASTGGETIKERARGEPACPRARAHLSPCKSVRIRSELGGVRDRPAREASLLAARPI